MVVSRKERQTNTNESDLLGYTDWPPRHLVMHSCGSQEDVFIPAIHGEAETNHRRQAILFLMDRQMDRKTDSQTNSEPDSNLPFIL